MPLSFTATPLGALAPRSRPAGSEGAGIRALLAVAGAKSLPELARSDTPGVAATCPPAVGADTADVAPTGAAVTWADTAARAGAAAAGASVGAGVDVVAVVARGVTAGR